MEGKLHIYHPKRRLPLFEYTPSSSPNSSSTSKADRVNVLVFIGGLFDNFRGTGYVDDLASLFPRNTPNQAWTVMHAQLSSAIRGWGTSDLNRDVEEMAAAIRYIRTSISQSESTNIVLMGHSTGCQDVLHYLYSTPPDHRPRPAIQGAILQAPVSDREGILHTITSTPSRKPLYDQCLSLANTVPESEHRTTILPMHWTTPLIGAAPVSISRFLSLASPDSPSNPGLDDLFSSDLPDSRLDATFGQIASSPSLEAIRSHNGTASLSKSILILTSGADEYVPPQIDKPRLLSRWKSAIESHPSATTHAILDPSSVVIPHARHDISGTTLVHRKARLVDMRSAVLHYLDRVVGSISPATWQILAADTAEIEREMKESGSPAAALQGVQDMKL